MKMAVLVLLLGALVWMVATLEQRSLYFPDKTLAATPQVYQLSYRDLALRAKDGIEVHGWFIPAEKQSATTTRTLLMAHGNAGNISHRLDKALLFHQLGLNVLLFDYRGYGLSKGVPSEKGTYRDAEAAYDFLVSELKQRPEQIILYGESLGCAVSVEMAKNHPAAALILESPFTSTVQMGKLVFTWLPVQLIVRYRYDNLAKIPNVHMPVLVMHSPTDEVIPFSMGRSVFEAANEPKRFFELTGGHNDGYERSGKRYLEAIERFLESLRTK
jgi:uncharacterized protein